MELFKYTGLDDIKTISLLGEEVWNYLKLRAGNELHISLTNAMKCHASDHELSRKVSKKWGDSQEEVDENLDGLANYVAEGIVEVIKE